MVGLLDLPLELIDTIIDELPETESSSSTYHIAKRRHDVKELRLACREVEQKTRSSFGREFFSELVVDVTPKGSARALTIVGDEMFGKSVKSIELAFGFRQLPGATSIKDWNDWKATLNYVSSSRLSPDLGKILSQTPRLMKLKAISSEQEYHAPLWGIAYDSARYEVGRDVALGWCKILAATFGIISTLPNIRLSTLYLGGASNFIETGIQTLAQRYTVGSTSLTGLRELSLMHIQDHFEDHSPFVDLLLLTPQLRTLQYKCQAIHHWRIDSIASSLSLLPVLSSIYLEDVVLDAAKLMESLHKLRKTLKVLKLDNALLANGEWREVFQCIRADLDLDVLYLEDLYEENPLSQVCLKKLMKDKAGIVNVEDLTTHQPFTIRTHVAFHTRTKDIVEASGDGWMWVEPLSGCGIYLDRANGDDTKNSLLDLEEGFELKSTLDY